MRRIALLLCFLLLFQLSACGYSSEDVELARKEGYNAGYDAGYEKGFDAGYREGYAALKPVSKPASGTILSGNEYDGSEITVTSDSSDSYVVSIRDSFGTEYVSFFVRAGDTVTVGVPAKYLYVYFASGTTWYGYGKGLMFGDNTVYSKDDDILDFTQYAWEYTLFPVTNGNFSETPSTENEFFG